MCGIVGYLGKRQVTDVLVNGLSNLQYRGYDSAGVAVVNENCISIVKKEGKLENLESALESTPVSGCVGIAHTRWATHGKPSDINSHPHYNADKTTTIDDAVFNQNNEGLRIALEDIHNKVILNRDDYFFYLVPDALEEILQKNLKQLKKLKKITTMYNLGLVKMNIVR